ncbi:MAG TPA: hypothetical protein VFA41_22750 [Ktedonobacteraceae bacterium]|jgi:hypothetical protein|nr:hypothetical protein [Ktedonobacteraceae bacterium]
MNKYRRFITFSGKGKKRAISGIVALLSLTLIILLLTQLTAGHVQQWLGQSPSSAHASDNTPGSTAQLAHADTTPGATKTPTVPPITISASQADITVDFSNRQNKAYPIPYRFLGVGGINIGRVLPANGNAVLSANFHLMKLGDYDDMAEIFPAAASLTNPSQQSWAKFDNQMALAAQFNLQPLISLASTPTWLEPQNQTPRQTNPCLTYNPPFDDHSVKPMYLVNGQDVGPQTWGKLAAIVVAHVDAKFPQLHAMYEIWNQPDGAQFLCEPSNDANADLDRVSAYRAIFAAAAPLMKQQGSRDGVQVQIGGPGLVYALKNHLTWWFPTLLNDPAVYPYMDFITYHRYMSSSSFNAGSTSLVGNEQDPYLGVAAQYEQIAKLVHSGKQPNAANTPIYLDEYSMTPCYPNVCRNHPTYAPLMNALFIEDLLNTVNDTHSSYGAAPAVPAGLAYYTWNIPQQNLCMFGIYDQQLDCGPQQGQVQPYPTYYAYDLFGASNYLDMTDGGYVATPRLVKPSGLYVSGFFTASRDSIAIVNTTSSSYSTLHVFLQNPGTSSTSGSVYTLKFSMGNPANSIVTSSVTLVPVSGGTGFMATITVPAYTTVGLSVGLK